MSEGLFVTGTGTEVGKTVLAAVLARSAAARGARVKVFKPAVSGLDDPAAAESDHALLRRASGSTQGDEEIAPYRFGPAVSPHLAAELAEATIDPSRLRRAAREAATEADLLICEGVGGLLVPLTPEYLVRDLAIDLGHPVVIVAAAGLGTINHTLLTIEATRAVGLEVRAVVLNPWPERPGAMERSNRETIARLGRVGVATLPRIDLDAPGSWPEMKLSGSGSDRARS